MSAPSNPTEEARRFHRATLPTAADVMAAALEDIAVELHALVGEMREIRATLQTIEREL